MKRNEKNPLGVAATLLNVLHSLESYELQRSEHELLKASLNKGLREILSSKLGRTEKQEIRDFMQDKNSWDEHKNKWSII